MSFPYSLKRFRNHKGLSQAELSRRSNLDHSYVSRLESGQRFPSRRTLERILKAGGATETEATEVLAAAGFLTHYETSVYHHPVLRDVARALESPKAQAIENLIQAALAIAEA